MLGVGVGLPQVALWNRRGSAAFSPASLFANGEQGWWYDPSNFATLFQDAAGTTPVTAVEQPVGLQLDLSKGLVLGPELVTNGDFSNGTTGWSNITATLSVVAGEGVVTSASSFGYVRQTMTTVVGKTYQFTLNARVGTTNRFTFAVASGVVNAETTSSTTVPLRCVYTATATTTNIWLQVNNAGTAFVDNISVKELAGNHRFQTSSANRPVVSARVNLHTKTDLLSGSNGWLLNGTPTITSDPDVPAGQGFPNSTKIVTTGTFQGPYQNVTNVGVSNTKGVWLKGGAGGEVVGITDSGNTGGTFVLTTDWAFYTKTWTTVGAASGILISASGKTVYVAGVDVRPADQGVGLPAYQRVNTSTDYDTTGFPVYIKPNGSNQFMQTNSINFTATDKMTVWAGVRKLSDAALAVLAELSPIADIGSFTLTAPTNGTGYFFRSKGTTTGAVAESLLFAAPITNTLTGLGNISGDLATLRVNGTQVAQSTADQGTGNYGNYPAYFYARAGTSLFFNGNDYGSIARGAASTATQITNGETYMAIKTGFTAPVITGLPTIGVTA